MESKFGKTENYRVLIRDKKGAYLLHPFISKTEKKFTKQRDSSMFWIFMHIHHYAHYKN